MISLVCWFSDTHLGICDNNNDDESIANDSDDGDDAKGDRNNDWGQDWKDAERRRVEIWPQARCHQYQTYFFL